MRLSTEFPNISQNMIDARIDALKAQIDQKLNITLSELRRISAIIRKTPDWYNQNASRIILETVANKVKLNKDKTQSAIFVTRDDLDQEDGRDFTDRVNKALKMRPTSVQKPQASNYGATESNKQNFFDSLKSDGEQILSDAEAALSEAKKQLAQVRDDSWQQLQQTQTYYSDLVAAITAGDTKALVKTLKGEASKNAFVRGKQALFMMPCGKHENVLLAISQMSFDTPVQETEVIATVLEHFGDDFVALQVIQQTISKIADADTKQKYQALALAFSGMFIPLQGEVINVNQIVAGIYERNSGLLHLQARGGHDKKFSMSEQEAGTVLDVLAARANFIRAFDNAAVNVNTITMAGLFKNNDGTTELSIYRALGDLICSGNVSEQEDGTVLDALAARANFIRAFDNAVVNVNTITMAGLFKNNDGTIKLSIYGASGDLICRGNVSEQEGQAVVDALAAERTNFISPFCNVAVNVNTITMAGLFKNNDGTIKLSICGASGDIICRGNVSEQEGQAVVDALAAERTNFISPFCNVAVNVNTITMAGLFKNNDGTIKLSICGASGDIICRGNVSEQEGQAVVDALAAERTNFISPFYNVAVNVNTIAKAGLYKNNDGTTSLSIYGASGDLICRGNVSEQEGQAVVDALAARANFIRAFDNAVVNVNTIAKAGLYKNNDGTTSLSIYGASGKIISSGKMTEQEGGVALKALRKTGQYLAHIQDNAHQRDALVYGIQLARSLQSHSEESTGSEGNNNYSPNESGANNVPLIIALGIMLYANDPDAASAIGHESQPHCADTLDRSGLSGELGFLTGSFDDAALNTTIENTIQQTLDAVENDMGMGNFGGTDGSSPSTFDSGTWNCGSDMGSSPSPW